MTTSPPWERERPRPEAPVLHRGTGLGEGRTRDDIFVGDPEEWVAQRSPQFADAVRPKPRAIEAGPMEFTTCVGMEPWPAIIWDVNAYYADLGISPRATKREIKDAYIRLEGHKSLRLTYIVKQLLNPSVRTAYDATQPGSVFFDRYIAEFVQNQMFKDQVDDFGRILTFDERVEQELMQVDLTKYMDKPFDPQHPIDSAIAGEHDRSNRWRWGYYLWDTDDYDTERLREWQGMLIEALARREAVLRLSVGLVGGSVEEPMKVEAVGYRVVVFLGEAEQPLPQWAELAADRVVHTVAKIQAERIPRT